MNDTQVLAHILAGEVGLLCPFEASLAIAFMFMSGRNRTWSGWDEPDVQHWWLSYTYWQFTDPTPTAHFMFSAADTLLPTVRRIIADRGPPLQIFYCQNGLALHAY